jgi:hypothetical protein
LREMARSAMLGKLRSRGLSNGFGLAFQHRRDRERVGEAVQPALQPLEPPHRYTHRSRSSQRHFSQRRRPSKSSIASIS